MLLGLNPGTHLCDALGMPLMCACCPCRAAPDNGSDHSFLHATMNYVATLKGMTMDSATVLMTSHTQRHALCRNTEGGGIEVDCNDGICHAPNRGSGGTLCMRNSTSRMVIDGGLELVLNVQTGIAGAVYGADPSPLSASIP
jgi:hypothetical protein